MKRIVIINGSMRKKSMHSLLKRMDSFFGDYQVEFFSIKDFDIKD